MLPVPLAVVVQPAPAEEGPERHLILPLPDLRRQTPATSKVGVRKQEVRARGTASLPCAEQVPVREKPRRPSPPPLLPLEI